MFDDRETEARAARLAGAGRVDAVEALEDALLVLVGDADALVGHGDLDELSAGRGHPAGGYAHPGAGRGVVHGVLDEVAEGGGELAAVAPDPQVGGTAGGHGDLLGAGLVAAAVDGLRDELVDADGLGVLQRVVVLDPGEVDELLDQIGEPGRLYLHAAREARHRLGVVMGVHDGLGEEGQRADRRLELMADVRDEVAPYRLDAAGLGEVLHQEEDQPGAERRDTGGDREGLPAPGAAPGEVQFDLSYLPVPSGVPGHQEHRLHGQLSAPDQAERVRGRAGLDDGVGLVEDDRGGAQDGQDGVHARRKHRVGVQGGTCGAFLLPLAEAERQHGDHTGEHSGDRCRCGDRRVHVHASRLGTGSVLATAIGVRARTLVAQSSPWSQGWFIWGGGKRRVQGRTWERGVHSAGRPEPFQASGGWFWPPEPPRQT